ncbi:hypothetical protein ACFOZY_11915 [Chungangia koreensis]|uniref:YqgU-like 6-bladed beta-propeller domain-containing protein n=1 Tax=Chungangia koreensis TaxID=752657 RepID=A0ABV8XAF8_9LACT
MRNFTLLIIGLILVLTGCQPEETEPTDVIPVPNQQVSSDLGEQEKEEWVAYTANPDSFYQTYGWLSDSEILIAEIEEGNYILRSYNFKNGEKKDIFKESMMVINTKIHSSKEFIALHISESPASAIIKIIKPDGTLVEEVKVESSELYIDWNDEDASLMMITAFYEDWSFDTFVFDMNTKNLTLFESSDPFVKWLNGDTLLSLQWSEHALSGGQIVKIHWRTGESELTDLSNVVFFDAYRGNLLAVHPKEDEKEMIYKIVGSNGEIVTEWSAPALSNYSQWFIPEVQWLVDGSMITLLPVNQGLIDETAPEFQYVKVQNGAVEVFEEKVAEAAFNCSPDGSLCLSGYESDHIIQFDPFKVWKWLEV